MIDKNERENRIVIGDLLKKAGLGCDPKVIPLSADGSSRKFWRISEGKKGLCLAVAPPTLDANDLAEARAARDIGLHLLQQQIRVPEQYGWDEKHGILLFEDLGDRKLQELVLQEQRDRKGKDFLAAIRPWYRQVVAGLAVMQVKGAISFDPQWCWDTPRYDRTLMLERESGYFLRAFWQDLLGMEAPPGLQEEFVALAEQAARISSGYFLHRDFQSRNIMVHGGEACIIDFQGGRLGPLAYDLASLLIDPYVALPDDFQEEVLEYYMERLARLLVVDRQGFRREYLLLALQRNLQIVGAFAFLSKQRGKIFFQQFLRPALISLKELLNAEPFAVFPILRKIVHHSAAVFSQ